jgi:hypothetical protein
MLTLELQSSIEGILENVWAKEVIETDLPFDVRRRALLAYMHVSAAHRSKQRLNV